MNFSDWHWLVFLRITKHRANKQIATLYVLTFFQSHLVKVIGSRLKDYCIFPLILQGVGPQEYTLIKLKVNEPYPPKLRYVHVMQVMTMYKGVKIVYGTCSTWTVYICCIKIGDDRTSVRDTDESYENTFESSWDYIAVFISMTTTVLTYI